MNSKTLSVLAAIAVVAALLAVAGQRLDRSSGTNSSSVGMPLLAGLTESLNVIERITIAGSANDPVTTLERTDGAWVVNEQDAYPADVAKIRQALMALAEARVLEEKTSNPDFYSRLGVEAIAADEARGVAVAIEAGGDVVLPTVVLGDVSGTSYRFARQADQALSVLIDRDPDLPPDPAQWVLPEIIDVRSARVQRVEITHADGERIVISKASREQSDFTVEDIPEGRELQYATVANVIGGALRELRLESVAREQDPRPDASAETEFWTFDGLVVTATGTQYDDEPWLRFRARFEADQALQFATGNVDGSVADEAPNDDAADLDAEIAAITDRVTGWRYRIPAHQYDQMTRRMSDLLKALESPAE
jgi:hypothetical protein